MEQTLWTAAQASIVEQMIHTDAYQLLLSRIGELENRSLRKIGQRSTDWDETNYLRGKLAGMSEMHPEVLMREVDKSRESEKP